MLWAKVKLGELQKCPGKTRTAQNPGHNVIFRLLTGQT